MTELQKAVYEVLESSTGAMQLRDIYAAVKSKVPHLCDDKIIPCPYCKREHPLWQHQAAWALQHLKQKKLVHSTGRGFWEAISHREKELESVIEGKEETVHERLKRKIREVGDILGRYAKEEYAAAPYVYDVVWKEVEGLPRPSHVFEVQDKGAVNGALAKLQHARDVWKPRLFLVITGERDRRKVDMLLKPYLEGTFHGIRKDTTVLTAETINEIHQALTAHREVIKQFLEV